MLVDSDPETVVPTIPPGQVTTPPASVVQENVLLNKVVDKPNDPLTPAFAPIIPWPVRDVTTQAFNGSPPFAQVLIEALFVSNDTVALTLAEIDGIDVVVLPNESVFKDTLEEIEVDDKLRVVPVAMLGLEMDTEGEVEGRLVDRPVFTLVDGELTERDVSRIEVGNAIPVVTDVAGRPGEVLDKVKETCVFTGVLGRLADGLNRLVDADGNPVDVVGKVTEIPVFVDVVGRLGEVLATLRESTVLSEVVGTLTDVDGRLTLVLLRTPVFKLVVGREGVSKVDDTLIPVLIGGDTDGKLVEN